MPNAPGRCSKACNHALLLIWIMTAATMARADSLAGAATERHPNILFVTIESMRADHAGAYGYARDTTPTLDALADEGTLFETVVTTSNWTLPAVMSMFTSLFPGLHGAVSPQTRLRPDVKTLPGVLREAGYQTAAIISNPMLHRTFGCDAGFDLYDDFSIALDVGGMDILGDGAPPRLTHVVERITGPRTTQLADAWLRNRDPDRPFFLHVFYFDPHYSYLSPPPYNTMFTDSAYDGSQDGRGIKGIDSDALTSSDKAHIVALYDGTVRFTDTQIARLLGIVESLGLEDRTLVIVTGDHGEEFWEHGSTAHGHTLYDELLLVPLVVRGPGVAPGQRIGGQISQLDIMPTLLAFLDLDIPDQCLGVSHAGLLRGGGEPPSVPAFMESVADRIPQAGLRTPDWKLIERYDTGAFEVYALTDDPEETRNLYGDPDAPLPPDLLARFRAWKAMIADGRRQASDTAEPMDRRLEQQLRSMGYTH